MSHDGATPIDATAAPATGRLDRLRGWTAELRDELARLPSTLRSVREGAENFQLVSNRLSEATRSLEDIAAMYEVTVADAARRSTAAADALRQQVETIASVTSPERLPSVVQDLRRSLDSLNRLNPLWPRPEPPDERTPR